MEIVQERSKRHYNLLLSSRLRTRRRVAVSQATGCNAARAVPDDLHVQQAQKTAAHTKPSAALTSGSNASDESFRRKLLQRPPEILVVVGYDRDMPANTRGWIFAKPGNAGCRGVGVDDRVADRRGSISRIARPGPDLAGALLALRGPRVNTPSRSTVYLRCVECTIIFAPC